MALTMMAYNIYFYTPKKGTAVLLKSIHELFQIIFSIKGQPQNLFLVVEAPPMLFFSENMAVCIVESGRTVPATELLELIGE